MPLSAAQHRPSPPGRDARAVSPQKRTTRSMAPTSEHAPLSDTETERPVTEQMQKATIAGLPSDPKTTAVSEGQTENGGRRGRLQRKRSFEEVEGEHMEQRTTSESGRGHTRKRSRDAVEEEAEVKNGKRVSGERSRDPADRARNGVEMSGGSDTAISDRPGTPDRNGGTEAEVGAIASPKTKRSRLHSTTGEDNGTAIGELPAVDAIVSAPEKDATASKPEPTDSTAPSTATPAPSLPTKTGFAALAASKSPPTSPPQTSSTAFASSGFGSLAASSKAASGFGAIGKSSGGFGVGGTFATGGGKNSFASKENAKPKEPAAGTFGSALANQSPFAPAPSTTASLGGGGAGAGFGSSSSGFGKLGGGGGLGSTGSGFGGSTGGFGSSTNGFSLGGGGLTSFASGKPSSSLIGGASSSKSTFGAPAKNEVDDDDDGGDDDAGFKSPLSQGEVPDKQDERFYQQRVETGEEGEETVYSCRAKLYNFAAGLENGKKEWRERGLGILRLNVSRSPAEDAEGDEESGAVGGERVKARFLMRADGSHRVVLNTPVHKALSFGSSTGGEPVGGFMLFMGTIGDGMAAEGKEGLELLQIKVKQQYALELYERVKALQTEM
ncbi:hypothetical protein LTR08_000027 [Meristemomyces frigidus]|nr:hypothetical protein LTR08_000027 [Meristemomyces frigidus]